MPENQLHKNVGERLTELVNQFAGGTSRQFAIKVGMDTSQFSKMQKGTKGLTLENAVEISTVFSVSLDWLLLGRGTMILKEKSGTEKAPDLKLLTQILENHRTQSAFMERLASNLNPQKSAINELPGLSEEEFRARAGSQDSGNNTSAANQQNKLPKDSSRKKGS